MMAPAVVLLLVDAFSADHERFKLFSFKKYLPHARR